MATFRSSFTNQQIENILIRSNEMDTTPFVLYYDSSKKKYRFFSTAEKRDAWIYARDNDVMTPEIAAYEFTLNFDAPAPNTQYIENIKLQRNGSDMSSTRVRSGTTGITLNYTFRTLDSTNTKINESVDVVYTIDTSSGTTTISTTYLYDTTSGAPYTSVSFALDDYLVTGSNVITISVTGRSSGATASQTLTVTVFALEIESSFDIRSAIAPGASISVPVKVTGDGAKVLVVYVDGEAYRTRNIADNENGVQIYISIPNTYESGKHNIQLQAHIDNEYTEILYFDFVISGKITVGDTTVNQRQILIKTAIDDTTGGNGFLVNTNPTLFANQYESTTLEYVFYSSDTTNEYTAEIQWEIENSDIQIQPVDIDSISESQIETISTLTFIPTDVPEDGKSFILKAKFKESYKDDDENDVYTYIDDAEYPLSVTANSSIYEVTNGLTMKLSAHGRLNTEPESSRGTWTYSKTNKDEGTSYNYSTEFSDNFQWSGDYGWDGEALYVKSGTYCVINNKPLSEEIAPQDKNGCTIEVDFETTDVDDDDAIVFSIGDPTSTKYASFFIQGSKATLRTAGGTYTYFTRFKTNERIKLAFIVFPKQNTSYPQMVFIQVNGVLSLCQMYDANDVFNVGSESSTSEFGMINIGNSEGKAGIKIYNIRTYHTALSRKEELNNYIIDCGSNITKEATSNNIYKSTGDIDVSLLTGTITIVYIVGNIDDLISTKDKKEIEASVTVRSPDHPEINMSSPHTKLSNAGQSTLGLPVPSMHVKMGSYDDNKVVGSDGATVLTGNRWTFRDGNVPEKKFRLQANYLDSSGCHNGAFLRLFNTVAKKLKINGKYVLLPPALRYVKDTTSGYSIDFAASHPNANSFDFPYEMNMVPDSIPCIVVWKAQDSDSEYKLLGQYVIMDEKKADYSSCKRSIYDNMDSDGNPDPFKFKTSGGNRLWDNSDCRQFEIVSNLSDLTYFTTISSWYDFNSSSLKYQHEIDFEMIYPDPDDVEADYKDGKSDMTVEDYWDEFKDSFVSRVVSAYQVDNGGAGSQAAFNSLYCDGPDQIFDRYAWAAYYCLAMRNCCVDSLVRNMEITTYGEKNTYTNAASAVVTGKNNIWLPKWWDVDMQCGVLQSGAIGAPTRATRSTEYEGIYLFSSKDKESGKSSWLWDALEGCEQFKDDVLEIDDALYSNGWTYDELTSMQDDNYIDAWNESLYNESGITKYVNIYDSEKKRITLYMNLLQGDRTPYRHWFLKSNYSYFDAINVCGDYKSNALVLKPQNVPAGKKFIIIPSENYYFGYARELIPEVTGVAGIKDQELSISLLKEIGTKDSIRLYAVNKMKKIDISEFAKYQSADLDFGNTKDSVLGTVLKELIVGVSSIENINNVDNAFDNEINQKSISFAGFSSMTRLETLNLRGFLKLQRLSDSTDTEMPFQSLKKVYAAGTSVSTFYPKDGCVFEEIELPSTVTTITMKNCTLPSDPSKISWYETKTVTREVNGNEETGYYVQRSEDNKPFATLQGLSFTAMGTDAGTQSLIIRWLHAIEESANITDTMTDAEKEEAYNVAFQNTNLTYTSATWYNVSYDDLILLSRVPSARRNLNGGYIVCSDSLTTEQMNTLKNKFGDYIFTDNSILMIDSNSNTIMISVSGDMSTVTDSTTGDLSTITLTQGNTYKFSGVVFPVKSSTTTSFTWSMLEYTNGDYYPRTSSGTDTAITTVRPITLYSDTGIMTIDECSNAALTGTKLKIKVVNDTGLKSGEAYINVNRRTYPESVKISPPDTVETVDDIVQITDVGTYEFDAVHYNPSDYNGNLSSTNGGIWSIDWYRDEFMSYTTTPTSFRLTINSEYTDIFAASSIEESSFSMSYTSHWMDPTKSCSASLNLNLISVIQEVLTMQSRGGNIVLYNILNGVNGIPALGDKHLYYSSLDLKKGSGILNFRDLIDSSSVVALINFTTMNSSVNETGRTYNIARYLSNINDFNLSGCTYFSDELNVVSNTELTSLNMYGTAAGANARISDYSNLRYLTLGTPTYVKITNPVYLTAASFGLENANLIRSIDIENLKDGTEMTMLMNIINNNFTSYNSILPALTGIKIESSNAVYDYLGATGEAIEKLSSLVTTHSSLTVSGFNATIKTKKMYADSERNIKNKFGSGLTVIHTDDVEYYRRWKDAAFEDIISMESAGFGGDGIGLTEVQAASSANISLGSTIKDNIEINDLSDLYIFENIQMPGSDSDRDSQFAGCANVKSISIPKNTTNIGKNTFTYMYSLTSVDFTHATSLTSIDYRGFYDCCPDNTLELVFGYKINDQTKSSTPICSNLESIDFHGSDMMDDIKRIEIGYHDAIEKLLI